MKNPIHPPANHPTPLKDYLRNNAEEDAQENRRFRLALASSIWLTLAAIWLPGLGFSKKVIDLPEEKIQKPNPQVTIRPKVERVAEPVKIQKKQRKKIPLPDLTPLVPEPEIEIEPIEEPLMIDTTPDMAMVSLPEAPPDPPKTVFTAGMIGVESPIFTKKVPPKFPRKAISVGMQGYVLIEAILGRDGSIREIKVLRGLGNGRFGFEKAAIEALEKWEFLPGKVKGSPADIRMNLRITFSLQR